MITEPAVFVIAVVALYDLWLVGAGRPTISQAYQAAFPSWADILILVPVTVGICFLPVWPPLRTILGVVAGHVFWANRERWIKK